MIEQRIYDTTTEVKQLLISVERLRYRAEIQRDYGGSIDLLEYAKIEAKEGIKGGIEKYILLEEVTGHDGQKFVEATIYLPYIYDEKMKSKDEQIKRYSVENGCLKSDNATMKEKIKWLELPWYKKLIKLITHK